MCFAQTVTQVSTRVSNGIGRYVQTLEFVIQKFGVYDNLYSEPRITWGAPSTCIYSCATNVKSFLLPNVLFLQSFMCFAQIANPVAT